MVVGVRDLYEWNGVFSDVFRQRGTADSRLVYAVSASTISGLEPLLQQFGIEYLTYTVGDNDYRVPRSPPSSVLDPALLEQSLIAFVPHRSPCRLPRSSKSCWRGLDFASDKLPRLYRLVARVRDINGAVHIPLNRLLLAKHAIAFGAGRRNVIDQR